MVNNTLRRHALLLKRVGMVDATLVAAPSFRNNRSSRRDPEMHQTKKGNNSYFGKQAYLGADRDSGLVHTIIGTAADVNDVTVGNALVRGKDKEIFADAGYHQTADCQPEAKAGLDWHATMKPSVRKKWQRQPRIGKLIDHAERVKASVRAKVEHPLRVLKRHLCCTKVRYRGFQKNTAQIRTLSALVNLWLARHRILTVTR